jgi:hypothetical protein
LIVGFILDTNTSLRVVVLSTDNVVVIQLFDVEFLLLLLLCVATSIIDVALIAEGKQVI